MTLDDYLHRFDHHQRITLVGPMPLESFGTLPPDEPIVWVDGGANHRRPLAGGDVGFCVGDGDSFHGKLDQRLDADKDYSDLAYVLSCLHSRFTEVRLPGFLGARRDHELFNFGEVHHFLAAVNAPTRARFDENVSGYSAGQWSIEIQGTFSLAVFAPTTVKLTGACQYPIAAPRKIAALKSLGLSNQGFGTITLSTRAPAFIFQPHYNDAPPRPSL